jgi:hypothetical protein
MYPLANSLIVLLHLQIYYIQDDSIVEGRVEGKDRFRAQGLLSYGAEKKRGLVRNLLLW